MTERHDLRRQDREGLNSVVVVMWRDASGNDKFANARALDVSELGLRLEMPEPIPVKSYITLRADKLGIQGHGSVRHCTRRHGKYIIGVELSGAVGRRTPSSR